MPSKPMPSQQVPAKSWGVETKADEVALVHLIRYSKEEAVRLGVSEVVVEFLRRACIELTNTIEN